MKLEHVDCKIYIVQVVQLGIEFYIEIVFGVNPENFRLKA